MSIGVGNWYLSVWFWFADMIIRFRHISPMTDSGLNNGHFDICKNWRIDKSDAADLSVANFRLESNIKGISYEVYNFRLSGLSSGLCLFGCCNFSTCARIFKITWWLCPSFKWEPTFVVGFDSGAILLCFINLWLWYQNLVSFKLQSRGDTQKYVYRGEPWTLCCGFNEN